MLFNSFVRSFKSSNNYSVICSGLVLLEMFDLSFTNSILGNIVNSFKINSTQIPILYTTFAIGAAVALPLTTTVCSRHNIKKIIVFCIMLTIPAFFVAGFIRSWIIFCTLRFIHGFLITLCYSVTYTFAIKFSENKHNEINLINGISIVGLLLGPVISGAIANFNWQLTFLFFSLISAFCLYYAVLSNFKPLKVNNKIKFSDNIIEYINLLCLLIGLSFLFENSFSITIKICILVITVTALYQLYKKYLILHRSYIFNYRVFNKDLLLAFIFNLFVRFTLSIIPLISFVLLHDKYSGINCLQAVA